MRENDGTSSWQEPGANDIVYTIFKRYIGVVRSRT
jgi:hypothetical protein